nr:hypothetical protein [Candidatus Sigynarchaeota archaeon]
MEVFDEESGNPPYIPDAWAKYTDGLQALYDVKPKLYLESLKDDKEECAKWTQREQVIKAFCEKNGLEYMILTEDEIFGTRYKNIEF